MEVYFIEGTEDLGKSSLILAQYRRLMRTNNYILVENEAPHSLDDFRLLIQNIVNSECILFNSPTDDRGCINAFDAFINKCQSKGYNITIIVTSIRPINYNPNFHKWVNDTIEKYYPGTTSLARKIDLTPLQPIK